MEIEINNITIPLIPGNAGVMLSGGADSSLLLYILLLHKTETLEVFTMASDFKGRMTAKTTADVIEKCIQLTGNNKINHHVYYTDVQNDERLFSAPREMLANKKISAIYTAVTANPSKDIADNFTTPIENVTQEARNPLITKSIMDGGFCCPFININKLKIAEIYSSLDLLNTLFPLTRSCELPEPPLNYLDHCTQCWWCKERNWAFNRYV